MSLRGYRKMDRVTLAGLTPVINRPVSFPGWAPNKSGKKLLANQFVTAHCSFHIFLPVDRHEQNLPLRPRIYCRADDR